MTEESQQNPLELRVLEPRIETYPNAEFDNPVLFDVIRTEATHSVIGGG